MEKYELILKRDIIFELLVALFLCTVVIIGIIFVTKMISKLDTNSKYKIIVRIVGICFVLGIFITTAFEICNPILDIKNNSFITYTGHVEYNEEHSNKYTDIYELKDDNNVIVEASSGTMKSLTDTSNCEAIVIYGKMSKKVVSFKLLNENSS